MSAEPGENTAARSRGLAPALYEAEVRHVRRQVLDRSFAHGVYLWLVDLDVLPENVVN